jgi:hypothetical protein
MNLDTFETFAGGSPLALQHQGSARHLKQVILQPINVDYIRNSLRHISFVYVYQPMHLLAGLIPVRQSL